MTKRIGTLAAIAVAGFGLSVAPVAHAQTTPTPPPPPPPTVTLDFGTLNSSAPVVTHDVTVPQGQAVWFKFTVRAVPAGGTLYLDIDDNTTTSFTNNDTMFGLYDSNGNIVATNDDGGAGALSALSFGATSPTRPGMGDGFSFAGQNGGLATGTYYLAVAGFPSTFDPGFAVQPAPARGGTITLRAALGPATAPLAVSAGDDQSVPEGTPVTLNASTTGGAFDCPPALTWTQVGGPSVGAIDATDPAHPTFTAPWVNVGGATVTLEVNATDCEAGHASDVVNIAITNVNHPPVASAGPDQTVAEGSPVALDASGSYDPDNDALAYSWAQTAGTNAVSLDQTDPLHPTFTAPLTGRTGDVLEFTVFVSDGVAMTSSVVHVTVENVNHAPVASAGSAASVATGNTVTLDASASSDPDNDPITFAWSQIGGTPVALADAATANPSFVAPGVLPAGDTLTFRVVVSDGLALDAADVSIFVHPAVAPPSCIAARPSVASVWPPNHGLVPISILGVTPGATIAITSVTQDEPINGTGDGDTAPDAVIQGSTVLVRAERAGHGNGRVYRIAYTASNAGGSCSGVVKVGVPHDKKQTAFEDPAVYGSTGH